MLAAAVSSAACASDPTDQRCGEIAQPAQWPSAAAVAAIAARADVAHIARRGAPAAASSLPAGPQCEAPTDSPVMQPYGERSTLALAWERAMQAAAQGGWPEVPSEAAEARPGKRHPAVSVLRDRLALEGYPVLTTSDVASPDLFDTSVATALRLYQHDHTVAETGLVDKATFRALDVPALRRAAQLRRALTLTEDAAATPTRIRVNIPAYEAVLYVNGAPVARTRTIVGAPYRSKVGGMTREMYGAVHTMVAHPPWIPTQSYIDEILAAEERRRPGAAARKGLVPIRRANGRRAYTMPPGPENPLGRLVLRFNPEGSPLAVFYLHDTPEQHLFAEDWRAHSSGCVRAEHIEDIAAAVAQLGGLDTATLRAAMANEGKTTVMRVPHPVAVAVEYSTADVGPDGRVRYHPDVYHLDPTILTTPQIAAR